MGLIGDFFIWLTGKEETPEGSKTADADKIISECKEYKFVCPKCKDVRVVTTNVTVRPIKATYQCIGDGLFLRFTKPELVCYCKSCEVEMESVDDWLARQSDMFYD